MLLAAVSPVLPPQPLLQFAAHAQVDPDRMYSPVPVTRVMQRFPGLVEHHVLDASVKRGGRQFLTWNNEFE